MRKYRIKEAKYPRPQNVPSHLLISFDLGKRKVGVAVFLCDEVNARLLGAEVVKVEGEWSEEAMANEVHKSLSPMVSKAFMPVSFVCEWPKKYATARKFHEDLDHLHNVGHAIARVFDVSWAETYTPSDWKGNVPKKAHKKRLTRELTLEEKVALTNHTAEALGVSKEDAQGFLDSELSHDLWDAIGIGLFAVARTRKGGTRV